MNLNLCFLNLSPDKNRLKNEVRDSFATGDQLLHRMKNATAKWIATQNDTAKTMISTADKSSTATERPSQDDGTSPEAQSAILNQNTFDVLTQTKKETKKKWMSEEARRVIS